MLFMHCFQCFSRFWGDAYAMLQLQISQDNCLFFPPHRFWGSELFSCLTASTFFFRAIFLPLFEYFSGKVTFCNPRWLRIYYVVEDPESSLQLSCLSILSVEIKGVSYMPSLFQCSLKII